MKIFNYFILIFTLTYNLFANDLKPVNILETSGGVTDLVLDKSLFVISLLLYRSVISIIESYGYKGSDYHQLNIQLTFQSKLDQ